MLALNLVKQRQYLNENLTLVITRLGFHIVETVQLQFLFIEFVF